MTNDTQLVMTLFDLPTQPDEVALSLPPAKLRTIDFSALDYSTAQRGFVEYVMTYYPSTFNDWVASSGVIMYHDILCSNVAKLSLRADLNANENFFPTCVTEAAAMNHMALINQKWKAQTPAVVDIEISVATPLSTDVHVDPQTRFSVRGPDGSPIYYEVFKAPGDFDSQIVLPAGKRGVVAFGLEGRFASPYTATSPGGQNQSITISNDGILDAPILIDVYTGLSSERWTPTTDPLERFGPADKVVNYTIYSDHMDLVFGDNVTGKAPLAGQRIVIRYRVGGGARGRIGANAINETRQISPAAPATASVPLLFRNLVPSNGGTDRESLEQAKRRAPRDFVVRAFASDRPASIVTDGDYAQVSSSFAHPVYGSVAKAIATIRTSLNANIVELYVLAQGPDTLVTPSLGLKTALQTYISEYNCLDEVRVLDGSIRPVDVDVTIVVGRSTDASRIKTLADNALISFFDPARREMGQPLYISDLNEVFTSIDGVRYVDILTPTDNILSVGTVQATSTPNGVGINEIITLGNKTLRVFYEKNRA